MADIKRLNYFIGQFLDVKDFQDEQQYLVDMRRRQNTMLYRPGILDGGFIITRSGDQKITVGAGVAVDRDGKELILLSPIEMELPPGNNRQQLVTITHEESLLEEDTRAEGDYKGSIRITERPRLRLSATAPTGDRLGRDIVIGLVMVDNAGTISGIDTSVRQYVGGRFPSSLTVGQGGNGVLNTRHIDGKDWRNDNRDDLFLNWDTGTNVYVGFGANTKSSLFVSGNIGIGTQSPTAGLEIDKGETNDVALRLTSSGAGWGSGVQFKNTAQGGKTYGIYSGFGNLHFSDEDNQVDRLLIHSSGNVGIGTTEPKTKLEIVGGVAINDGKGYAVKNSHMASGSLTIGSIQQSYGGGVSQWHSNTAGLLLETLKDTEIAVYNSATRLASLMYYEGDTDNRITIGRDMGWGTIKQTVLNGNVGIGTSNPLAPLQIGGGVDAPVRNTGLYIANPDGSAQLDMRDSASDIEFQVFTYAPQYNGFSGHVFLGTFTNHRLVLRTKDLDRMIITETGNVGIGTMQPGAKLTIQTPDDYSGDTIRVETKRDRDSYSLNLKAVTETNIVRWVFDQKNFGTSFPNVLAFDRGKVGIGTTQPRRALDVNGEIVAVNRLTLAQDTKENTGTWHVDHHNERFRIFNQKDINTNGVERLTIDTLGTVGIEGTLRIGGSGSLFSSIQAGTASVGAGVAGINIKTVRFPSEFTALPRVIATARGREAPEAGDTFAVTIRNVNTMSFTINIVRVDPLSGQSWGQDLNVDWLAWV